MISNRDAVAVQVAPTPMLKVKCSAPKRGLHVTSGLWVAYAGTESHGNFLQGPVNALTKSPSAPYAQRKLKAEEVGVYSVTSSWWWIMSSIVPTVLSSCLSPGLGSTPPCRLLGHLYVFTASIRTISILTTSIATCG